MNPVMMTFMGILLVSVILVMYRLAMGPTAPDRAVALDILGIILINVCVILSLITKQDYYITAGLVMAVLSFVASLALAKFLEGKKYND